MNQAPLYRQPTTEVLSIPLAPAWHNIAACSDSDPEIFFPGQGRSVSKARAICASCPVRERCLAENICEDFGVWGGTSERDRRALRARIRRERGMNPLGPFRKGAA